MTTKSEVCQRKMENPGEQAFIFYSPFNGSKIKFSHIKVSLLLFALLSYLQVDFLCIIHNKNI